MKPAGLLVSPLLVVAVAALSSCGDPSAPPELLLPQASLVSTLDHTATKRASKTVRNTRLRHLPQCDPLPTSTASATIGFPGGIIAVGPHTLDIPRGALLTPVTITAVAPSDSVAWIQFQPDGLVFTKSATLTMSYVHCNLEGRREVEIAQVSNELLILEYLPSVVFNGQKVTGRLDHFSNYAVAW